MRIIKKAIKALFVLPLCCICLLAACDEQDALTEEGKEPEENTGPETGGESAGKYKKIVRSIIFTPEYWADDYSSGNDGQKIYEFQYDAQERVSGYDIRSYNAGGELQCHLSTTLDYVTDNEIRITDQWLSELWDDEEPDTYTVMLNDRGNISQVKHRDDYSDNGEICYHFVYDENNCLTKWYWQIGMSEYGYLCTYKEGVISSITSYDSYDGGIGSFDTEDGQEEFFGTVPNDLLNIDLNMLFAELEGGNYPFCDLNHDGYYAHDLVQGRTTRLALLRLLGNISPYYVKKWDGSNMVEVDRELFSDKPNVTIHQEGTRRNYESDNALSYTFHEDASVQTLVYTETVIKYNYEYDLVIGNEKIDEYGELYRGEIKNYKATEVARGTNTYTYTFVY